ncbi:MAG: cadherin-like domain-containing protein [Caldilineaceae bacterium]|nr:cadherin-like domain-containing protein [Caldilineaceae bacterium]
MNISNKTVGGFIVRTSMMLTLLLTWWLLQTPSVQAAGPTCTVGASGATYTTIQAAVNDTGCATINVAAGTYDENITIARDVTINGATTGSTIVDGAGKDSVFQVTSGVVTLNSLTIQHGFGYVYNSARNGGGIFNMGTLTVNNSTFLDNGADFGGAINNWFGSTLTVNNSTFSGNRVTSGGGIYNRSTASISNSTFSGNSAIYGGDLYNYGGIFILKNTILANALSGGNCINGTQYSVTSGQNNLIQDATKACEMKHGVNGNLVGLDPKLGPLQNNGGATPTMLLLPDSPAIDAGDDTACQAAPVGGFDQRGSTRPKGVHCDIGAVEAIPLPLVTVSFTPNGRNGYFTTNPAVGRVTALGEASVTAIACENAVVSNQSGLGTVRASATVTVNGAGGTLVKCRATDSAGRNGAATGSQNVVYVMIDATAPKTTIASQPTNPTGSNTATFTFSGVDSGNSGLASFQCQLDNRGFAACTSPQSYSGLSLGTHTFQTRAVDNAGNVEANPATYSWSINTPLPMVTLSFTPNGQNGWFTTNPAVGRVTATSQSTITNIRCNNARIDNLTGLGTSNASATVSVNAEGSLTIVTCTATDSAGQTGAADGSPNRADIWLDSLAPDTAITAQPANPASDAAASFHFTGSDTASAVAGYQCQLDGGSFAPCTSPTLYSGLSNGSHTFQVRAIDQAGNVDASPASVTWLVNVPPTPTATATNTAVPPTATPTMTPTATNTAVPPTATATATNTAAAPVANNDSYTTNAELPLTMAVPGVLANDTDADSFALTAMLVSNPVNGTLIFNANGGFSYLPNTGFVGTDSFTYQVSDGQATSNIATVTITVNPASDVPAPVGITSVAAVEVIGAPCAVAPNVLENDSSMRIFPERLAYALPSAVTVIAPNGSTQVLPAGTLVDSYYLHADWINNGQNVAKLFKGNVSFSQPILGIIKSSDGLLATNALLGAPGTTYATNTAQGLEAYDDNAWFSNGGSTLHLWLNVYDTSDALRIITPARPGLTLGGAVEGIGSPCSVVEGQLERDSTMRFFAERLNTVLPETIMVPKLGKMGFEGNVALPQGTRVNVYYLHADLLGDGQGKALSGSVTFNAPILGVIVDGAALNATHNLLGATWHPTLKTAYGTRDDQGIETGDRIGIVLEQNRLDFTFSGNGDTDQIRIITAAPGDATTVSAAAVVEEMVPPMPEQTGVVDESQRVNHIFLPLVTN